MSAFKTLTQDEAGPAPTLSGMRTGLRDALRELAVGHALELPEGYSYNAASQARFHVTQRTGRTYVRRGRRIWRVT